MALGAHAGASLRHGEKFVLVAGEIGKIESNFGVQKSSTNTTKKQNDNTTFEEELNLRCP